MDHIYISVISRIATRLLGRYESEGLFHRLEKQLYLQQIDELWKDHLRRGPAAYWYWLAGYGQRDPKKEYQKELISSRL